MGHCMMCGKGAIQRLCPTCYQRTMKGAIPGKRKRCLLCRILYSTSYHRCLVCGGSLSTSVQKYVPSERAKAMKADHVGKMNRGEHTSSPVSCRTRTGGLRGPPAKDGRRLRGRHV